MTTIDVQHMDIDDFVEQGFLQEANRQFFHPHGLALEVSTGFESRAEVQAWLEKRGVRFGDDAVDCVWTFISRAGLNRMFISGVWDYRGDPEGVLYGPDVLDAAKADRVNQERMRHVTARHDLMGSVTQPLDWTPPT